MFIKSTSCRRRLLCWSAYVDSQATWCDYSFSPCFFKCIFAPQERPQIIIQVTKHMHVPIYLAGKSSSHKRERGQTQTRRPWRHMQGAAKWCNYKCLNILCVDWSIADLVMVDWRSNPFPVYGIFTHSQQSRKNHMVKCCLIYDKCINAKRLFLFFFWERGCFKYPLQWTAGFSWDCAKALMNSAEGV